jgi:hypothetical protein
LAVPGTTTPCMQVNTTSLSATAADTLQAITAMARQLRSRKHNTGLILANGGMLTHQHALCLSAQPRGDGRAYPEGNPLPEVVDAFSPPFTEIAEGRATIEVPAAVKLLFSPLANTAPDLHHRVQPRRHAGGRAHCRPAARDGAAIPRQPRRRPNAVPAGVYVCRTCRTGRARQGI